MFSFKTLTDAITIHNNLFWTMITADEERAKLDAALDAALDALDDSEDEEEVGNRRPDDDAGTSQTDTLPVRQTLAPSNGGNNTPGSVAAKPSVGPSNPASVGLPRPADSWSPEKLFEEMMHQMIEGNHVNDGSSNAMMEDELFGKLLAEMQKFEVQEGSTDNSNGKNIPTGNARSAVKDPTPPKSTRKKPKSAATASPQRKADSAAAAAAAAAGSALPSAAAAPDAKAELDQQAELQAALATMMQGLEQAQQRMVDSDQGGNDNDHVAAASEGDDFAVMHNLLESLASAAGIVDGGGTVNDGSTSDESFNADAVVNGMMEQLLSKDLMYDPMKQVASRFPDWLREHQGALSATKLAEYVQANNVSTTRLVLCSLTFRFLNCCTILLHHVRL
jgi:Pex19 protein family